jgi:hypothetical protein
MTNGHVHQFTLATIAHETGVVTNDALALSDDVHVAMQP